ncbi:hypothetical protein DN752_03995 [Echinicola strongylocentroti]|uniref:Uncharacterized protein n=1 Tax=Echinicola strongylocentroti TaxID=1795355 RepID=A0A2Z4IF94_9BACT|nr:hypothetical protein DN752_03995 [Echinicola strongylocentroti]
MPKTKVKRLILKQFKVATDRLMHIPGLSFQKMADGDFFINRCKLYTGLKIIPNLIRTFAT